MIPFRRILFPVDLSDACRLAAPHVVATARLFSAEVVALKAFRSPLMHLIASGADVPTHEPLVSQAEIEERERSALAAFAAANLSGVKTRTLLAEGEPAEVIERFVRAEGIDLVMMPTHGEGLFRRLLVGSVTTKVLHDLSCAVWTDTHAALESHAPTVPYKSVVCALDLTEESRAVLNAAGAMAKYSGAPLHLVHSVEIPPTSYQMDFGPYQKELIEAAEQAIRNLRSEAQLEATISVGSGMVANVIRTVAEKYKADLVVTGRGHAQGGASRVWSALYSIVRDAPCPVLSI